MIKEEKIIQDNAVQEARTLEEPTLWRSLDEREGTVEFSPELDFEYTPSEEELTSLGLNRRRFMQLMGASMAMATAAGCIRKEVQYVLPYAKRPEDIIPGNALYYATAFHTGKQVLGVLVESQEGRPTKVEGNPRHPMSLGASSQLAQASVLDLYDQDRSQYPLNNGKKSSWAKFFKAFNARLETAAGEKGSGLTLLVDAMPSPTYRDLLAAIKTRYPQARVFQYDATESGFSADAFQSVGLSNSTPLYSFDKADVVLSLDSDFLKSEGDVARSAKGFSSKRDLIGQDLKTAKMNRLYAVEGRFSVTGTMADHRLNVRTQQVGEFLVSLLANLVETKKVSLPKSAGSLGTQLSTLYAGLKAQGKKAKTAAEKKEFTRWSKWVEEVGVDLVANKGRSAVVVGDNQPAYVHGLALLLNGLLGNVGAGKPVEVYNDAAPLKHDGGISELAASIKAGAVKTLVMLGGNPVYTAPGGLGFKKSLESVPFSAHLSLHVDETSQESTWHLPAAHYLEAWGDLKATDGTVSIQQPLISPLYPSLSPLELAAHIAGSKQQKGYDLVKGYWKKTLGKKFSDNAFKTWLHDGIVGGSAAKADGVDLNKAKWTALAGVPSAPNTLGANELEFNFLQDYSVLDGRFANNPWLQETPDPLSKLTWDNAALVSTELAEKLGLKDGNFVKLTLGNQSLEIPTFRAPGVASDSVFLPMGYGRTAGGQVLKGAGFDVNPLRSGTSPFTAGGGSLKKIVRLPYKLASTQSHGRLDADDFAGFGGLVEPVTNKRRDAIAREASLKAFQKDPKMVQKATDAVMPRKDVKTHLWTEPTNYQNGQQWGMTIDLNLCTGCNTCVTACQAENNIPVVGKERIMQGREMSWIRIDRYFVGKDKHEPEVITQPIACVHCEMAPCENVCPVAATAHSPDGMNDIAYNRCIGTRFCANNCPYKVRRFNFFNFSKENDKKYPLLSMQRNPDVTVRFRGVIEKCSYCVQRVNQAKIVAKSDGDGVVADGKVTPACEQACPSNAIVFGDINDPNSRVSKRKKDLRNYAVLNELNIRPRTTFLARVRNRNPKLELL